MGGVKVGFFVESYIRWTVGISTVNLRFSYAELTFAKSAKQNATLCVLSDLCGKL